MAAMLFQLAAHKHSPPWRLPRQQRPAAVPTAPVTAISYHPSVTSTPPPAAAGPTHAARDAHALPDGRREPSFGAPADLDFRADVVPVRRARRRAASRGWWRWLLAIAIVGIGLAFAFRQPIGDWVWPQNRAQALRAQAAQALQQGRLTAADGSGARELYAAALAIDPDRSEARQGLQRVAQAALAQADAAARQNRFDDAHAALTLAHTLSVPRAEAERVEAALRVRETEHAGLPTLLSRAAAARAEGRLTGDDSAALPLYARVLALQPDNGFALEGREDALGALLEQARAGLRSGDVVAATAAIAQARRFDPGHVDLPDTEARLNEELDDVRRSADADLRAQRLDAALARYRSLQAAGAQADGDAGVERVAAAYAERAGALAGDFQFAQARSALDQARALSPDLPAVADAERHIARAQQSRARIDAPLPPRDARRRVATLLAQAAAAEARGDLLLPPGDSAFDKLRAARAIAPTDAGVRRASARLLPSATRCFERGLSDNDLAAARTCLDARAIVDTDDRAVAAARRRLAQRWLAVGDERLGAGNVSGASAALAAARSVDPRTPGLRDFGERVRVASAR